MTMPQQPEHEPQPTPATAPTTEIPSAATQPTTELPATGAPPPAGTVPPPPGTVPPPPGAFPAPPPGPRAQRARAWLRTRTGVAVLVAAFMLVFGVIPAGAVGFAAGMMSGGMHHSRFDDRDRGWPADGQRRYRDDGQNQRGDQRQQRQWPPKPGRPGQSAAPAVPASPSAS